jgi:hypothetical protein
MRRTRLLLLSAGTVVLFLASLVGGCGGDTSAYGRPAQGPTHIFVIMMENHATDEIIGNTADAPYLSQLASRYGTATQYYGVTHPSLPNYLALISGSSQGIFDDCAPGHNITCKPQEFADVQDFGVLLTPDQIAQASAQPHEFGGQTIVDQLEAHHLTWKAYLESMPSAGYTQDAVSHQIYRAKHNPFVYFKDIVSSSARLSRVVPATQLTSDLQADRVPNFVFLAPNQCHDMHGLSAANAQALQIPQCATPASGLDHSVIALGDQYLAQLVPQIMRSKAWSEGSVLVIVWDENDYMGYAGCCHSPTGANGVVLGGAIAPIIIIPSHGAKHLVESSTQYNHYSLLATIEQIWGLPCLNNACGFHAGQLMTQLFGS